ncbi:hypothetical protein [Pseudobacteriovorax antillogorgiicola]|uniref:Uncharacterized protein n=1 Tax=Pseudobacteriovorax antillogorgiicola TaxID=1513793 RepID=A0A1Y6CN11_9BACT|nr:hypothetical protein [Pseudobacteriovorax antillogorgiicola]TCS44794.1 hypothetical protein EDD56_13123 [Pseudobacteriovorax antillogorgiicola]SMF77407.1 hypothetical protein SAMN06296036_13141 [Pseudobacteriovorax antillogorgiicola]
MRLRLMGLGLGLALTSGTGLAQEAYQGSRFQDVWEQVTSDPYDGLPQYQVTFKSLFDGFRNLLLESSERTIDNQSDVLPYFNKLLHPNGVCLKGTWNITAETDYTGYFAKGSEGLIIARASTALSNTKTGTNRAFGLAGKIYPTTDEGHLERLKTANFFTIEDLGGKRGRYFLDAENTNDIIKISPSLTAFLNGLVGATAGLAFAEADDSNILTALIRELYPIGELGLAEGQESKSPIWMRVVGNETMPRIDAGDFRDELNIGNYPGGLIMDIEVASDGKRLGKKKWQKIGYIRFDDSAVSSSCDHRLHFAHPKSRKQY